MHSTSHIYGVSPTISQIDAIVGYIEEHWPREDWPHALIFLPNRRSVALLQQAFLLRSATQSCLLPMMLPLADIPESLLWMYGVQLDLPTRSMPRFEHRMMLKSLVQRFLVARGEPHNERYALLMAESLAQLYDECRQHGIQFSQFSALVPEAFGHFWQETLSFLALAFTQWAAIEEASGSLSDSQRQHAILSALTQAWQENPPSQRIMAAGSTASLPITAGLLQVIAGLPKGVVLLPGVARAVPSEPCSAGHPLYHIERFALHSGKTLAALSVLGDAQPNDGFFNTLFADNLTQHTWPTSLQRVLCANEWEEARVVSLLVRESLETPDKTIMVVSGNAALLTRVQTLLSRWGIDADSSSAVLLSNHPFIQWSLRLCAMVKSDFAASDVLAFFQYPLTVNHQPELREVLLRNLDKEYARVTGLERGYEPFMRCLMALLPDAYPAKSLWVEGLVAMSHATYASAEWARVLLTLAEASGAKSMYDHDASGWLDTITAYDDTVSLDGFILMCEAAAEEPWFAKGAKTTHPRVMLHTPLEARMAVADRVIMAGLNEGSWPVRSAQGWLNRDMRARLGLPSAEEQYSLAAHDFWMLVQQPEVFLVRAEREQGALTLPNRWWQRLALAAQWSPEAIAPSQHPVLMWARMLDAPHTLAPSAPVMPNPSIALRPQSLSTTDFRQLLYNPYAVYAKHVLKITKLDPIDGDLDGSDFGQLAHALLEWMSRQETHSAQAYDAWIDRRLKALCSDATVRFLWKKRLLRIAAFYVDEHHVRAASLVSQSAESTLSLTLHHALGDIVVRGRADRIEQRISGARAMIDYKTGSSLPSIKQCKAGAEPQLIMYHLAQAHAARQSLSDAHCEYWKLPAGADEGKVQTFEISADELLVLEHAYGAIAAHYLLSAQPMLYGECDDFDEYADMARVAEWR